MPTLRECPALLLLLAAVLGAGLLLLHVHVHLQLIQVGYELSRETKVRHDLEEQHQRLRLELDVRENPTLVDERAHKELGMAPPDPTLIHVLNLPRPESGSTPAPAAAPEPERQARP
ncbi:MAG TPA: cell division protein FtsL [Polyangia bacterium]|nr:cell division protein FtsL [Polyangia bacterium]